MGVRLNHQDDLQDKANEMLYVALLHYPVYNKNGAVVTTAIANMDIHDIARTVKTYAAGGFYIVNPIEEQRSLAQEIVHHWREGYGARYNPFRRAAFELIKIEKSLQAVLDDIIDRTGRQPKTIVTGAKFTENVLKYAELQSLLKNGHCDYLLIFGTGSGISDELINASDFKLESIKGASGYNHLSVRSAVAIILDRIMRV